MWEATIDERPLKFHLAGINNQNFIMRDQETGTWWQQVTGDAILGPLKGRRLNLVLHDELSLAVWKSEHADGRVLRPDERVASAGHYAPADWEERIGRMPVVTATDEDSPLEPRALVVGVNINGQSKAYPLEVLRQQRLIIDSVGGVPILVVLGSDNKSVRGFERKVGERELEFFAKTVSDAACLIDSKAGSEWDFAGRALKGPLAGRQLQKVFVLKDYWFDWKAYHPDTAIYR